MHQTNQNFENGVKKSIIYGCANQVENRMNRMVRMIHKHHSVTHMHFVVPEVLPGVAQLEQHRVRDSLEGEKMSQEDVMSSVSLSID